MRGGIPREDDWARAPDQPTILCTTIDQLGSRLLFRGYGVSPSMSPVHAGLLGQDALLLLDEAHLSRPFRYTLAGVRRLQRSDKASDSKKERLDLHWRFCALTATPPHAEVTISDIFELSAEERAEDNIARRLQAKKRIALVEEKVAPGSEEHVALFVERAMAYAGERPGATIAVIVNRVRLAHAIRDALAARQGSEAILLTGRARPCERDLLVRKYQKRLEGRATDDEKGEAPLFVVATQCIEVGADYDFDAMITQIAPLAARASVSAVSTGQADAAKREARSSLRRRKSPRATSPTPSMAIARKGRGIG